MSRVPTNSTQQTGSPLIDRIQGSVRALGDIVRTIAKQVSNHDRQTGIGGALLNLSDVDTSITTQQADCAWIRLQGTLSAARTVTWPYQVTDATTHIRWVTNGTTGGFAITFKTPQGLTASIPNGTTRAIVISTLGALVLV